MPQIPTKNKLFALLPFLDNRIAKDVEIYKIYKAFKAYTKETLKRRKETNPITFRVLFLIVGVLLQLKKENKFLVAVGVNKKGKTVEYIDIDKIIKEGVKR